MNKKEQFLAELSILRSKITRLEENELSLIKTEAELKATNQQLHASNQQLAASEQQLIALNEQLRANEQELRKKEVVTQDAREYAENIITTVRVPLVVLNNDLRVVTVNQFFCTTFQVFPEETEGKLLYNLGNKQWNIPSLKTLLKDILPKKTVIEDFELEHTFEEIGKKIMLLNARELKQGKDKNRLILLSIQDITERWQAEQSLQLANSELEVKTKDLQQFLYITTHDLRSPLVNIQGFNKELGASLKELNHLLKSADIQIPIKEKLSGILEDEIPEAMHFITSSTNKMDALLTGLLTLSRLGRQIPVFKNVNMNQLMQEVINTFSYEINQNNVVVHVSDLPKCRGDETQLNQLLSNILGNALKFLDPKKPGIINITGEITDSYFKYKVQDNGIGIHPDHQEKVFELFHKLDIKKPGIGLGMNIIKQIIEKHKGKIKLESKNDIGTNITIFIPIQHGTQQ